MYKYVDKLISIWAHSLLPEIQELAGFVQPRAGLLLAPGSLRAVGDLLVDVLLLLRPRPAQAEVLVVDRVGRVQQLGRVPQIGQGPQRPQPRQSQVLLLPLLLGRRRRGRRLLLLLLLQLQLLLLLLQYLLLLLLQLLLRVPAAAAVLCT